MRRCALLSWLVVSLFLATDSTGQGFLGLSASVHVRANSYSGSPHVATVFIGEPVELVTRLYNDTPERLVIGGEGRAWDSGLTIVRRTSTGSREIVRERVGGPAALAQTLGNGQSTSAVWRLADSTGAPLAPGLYEIEVSVTQSSLGRPDGKDRLSETVHFEVKPPTTQGEQIDHALHMAYWALLAHDEDLQAQWVSAALRIDPESVVALADLGGIWRRRKDCSRAKTEFEKVVQILERGGDGPLMYSDLERSEMLGNTRAAIASCAADRAPART